MHKSSRDRSIAWLHPAAVLVYGTDKHLRLQLKQWVFTFVVYSCYVLLMGLLWKWQVVTTREWIAWSVTVYTGELAFYALIRSGFSRRFKDSALTREQICFGILTACAAYNFAGPHGAPVLYSLLLTLLFGAFSLSSATTWRLTGYAMACIVGAALIRTGGALERMDVFNLGTLLFVLPGIAVLSMRLGEMRSKLYEHKRSLEKAYARIELLAVQDELTGLLNRRSMNAALQREQSNAERGGTPACVAMLDIDHFKRINDTYGHAGGDVVLQSFAHLAQKSFRATDLVARWGGEEFLVLMPQTSLGMAVPGLERLLNAARESSFPTVSERLRLTVSVGLACIRPNESAATVVERADRALYEAKTHGRDRLVIDGP